MKLHCTCGMCNFDMRTEEGIGWDAYKVHVGKDAEKYMYHYSVHLHMYRMCKSECFINMTTIRILLCKHEKYNIESYINLRLTNLIKRNFVSYV